MIRDRSHRSCPLKACALLFLGAALVHAQTTTLTVPILSPGGRNIFWLGAPSQQICYSDLTVGTKKLELVTPSAAGGVFTYRSVDLPTTPQGCIDFSAPASPSILTTTDQSSFFWIIDTRTSVVLASTPKFALGSAALSFGKTTHNGPKSSVGIRINVASGNPGLNGVADRVVLVSSDGSRTDCYVSTQTPVPPGKAARASADTALTCVFQRLSDLARPVRFEFYADKTTLPVAVVLPGSAETDEWDSDDV